MRAIMAGMPCACSQPALWDCNIHPASGCSTSICFLWGSPSCKIWEKYPNLEIKALPSLASFPLPFGRLSYALHFAWTHSLMLGQIPSGSRFSSPLRSATHPFIADTCSLLISHLPVSKESTSFLPAGFRRDCLWGFYLCTDHRTPYKQK